MIRLWFTRGTSVSVKEQLTAQLLLGILSRRLAPGERLPSVRDLARRIKLHPNTVSAVYSDLAERGWIETRHGSGVFVRAIATPAPAPELDINVFARSCLDEGVRRGFNLMDLRDAFKRTGIVMGTQRGIVIVDPDLALGRIIAAEIKEAIHADVTSALPGEAAGILRQMRETDTFVVATRRSLRRVRQALPDVHVNPIGIKALEELLAGVSPVPLSGLIAVVSKSETVLQWAGTLLPALGVAPEAFILRNSTVEKWSAGLSVCSLVAADLLSEPEIPPGLPRIAFRLLSQQSLEELRALAGTPDDLFGRDYGSVRRPGGDSLFDHVS